MRLYVQLLVCCFSNLLLGFSVTAADMVWHSQDTYIQSNTVKLAATFHIPSACPEAGCGVLVLGHGSAPTTRADLGFYKNIGTRLGYAVLAFDKRGCGESEGTYERFSVDTSDRVFQDLADDMAAAAHWVSRHPAVNPKNIGMLGGSQAGWIMPLAVAKGAPASFIIIGEGVPLTAGQENIHGATLQALRGSESAQSITFKDLHAADTALESYTGPDGYNPAAVLTDIDVPTLWVFGLRDYVIPVLPSLRVLEGLLTSGSSNHTIHILPFGDHNFTNVATGGRYDLVPILKAWLEYHPSIIYGVIVNSSSMPFLSASGISAMAPYVPGSSVSVK